MKDAINHGARVMIGTSAETPILEKGFVRGVNYGGIYGKGEARANVVVDASGPAGVLASKLKLRKPHPYAPAVGIESIVEDKAIVRSLKRFNGTLAFYLGDEYVPHGYGWIFSFGKDAFKVGCCVYDAVSHGIDRSDYSDLMAVFQKFLGRFPEFEHLQITELHGGDIFVTSGMERDYGDGFSRSATRRSRSIHWAAKVSGTGFTRDGWPPWSSTRPFAGTIRVGMLSRNTILTGDHTSA